LKSLRAAAWGWMRHCAALMLHPVVAYLLMPAYGYSNLNQPGHLPSSLFWQNAHDKKSGQVAADDRFYFGGGGAADSVRMGLAEQYSTANFLELPSPTGAGQAVKSRRGLTYVSFPLPFSPPLTIPPYNPSPKYSGCINYTFGDTKNVLRRCWNLRRQDWVQSLSLLDLASPPQNPFRVVSDQQFTF